MVGSLNIDRSRLECGLLLIGLPEQKIGVGLGPFHELPTRPAGSVAFYLNNFELSYQKPWLVPQEFSILGRAEFAELFAGLGATQPEPLTLRDPDRDEFRSRLETIKKHILAEDVGEASGEVERWFKVVPAMTGVVPLAAGADSFAIFAHAASRAAQREGALNIYGGWGVAALKSAKFGECSGFIGLTPEFLFELPEARVLKTAALAGTAVNVQQRARLLMDPKERFEHALVADAISERLQLFGNVTVSAPRVLELNSLAHLCSDVVVELNATPNLNSLVAALHPTPAVGGVPRESTGKWIIESESHSPRYNFAAPFGIALPDGSSRVLVSIRGAFFHKDRIRIPSGCGIVSLSEEGREWAELAAKRAAVFESLFGSG